MEYSTPELVLQQQAANPILGNTLLLLAVLLFLAVLPRALRHILVEKEHTALDRAVERFQKEEIKIMAAELLSKDAPPPEEKKKEEYGGIPPFATQEEDNEEETIVKEVKIVKEGVPISHNEDVLSSTSPKKKVKLIKQEMSIAPDKNRKPAKKIDSKPAEAKGRVTPTKVQNSSTKDSHESLVGGRKGEESEDSWVEAEIPGLVIEPPQVTGKSEDIPTFKASPKAKYQSEAEKPQKPLKKEKQGMKVKNIARKTEEKKDSKPKKQEKIKAGPPELESEISESKPKAVEIKAPVVSHKNIAKEKSAAEEPSTKVDETQEIKAEATVAPPQQEDTKAPLEKAKPKPFLLDLKYLDQKKEETPAAREELPDDIVDAVIARLNALQVDLENQLVSIPDKLIPGQNLVGKNMRKDRTQDSLPDLSDKKEVSLDELDSFLFTATQRKK